MSSTVVTTTTQAVADTISLSVVGQNGNGFVHIPAQASTPSGVPSTGITMFADSSNDLSWKRVGFLNKLRATGQTADRIWDLPDASGEVLLTDNSAVISNKTILSSDGNIVDVASIGGYVVVGTPSNGDLFSFNTTANEINPLTLHATAPISYSAGNISAIIGQSAGTLAAGNDNRFSTQQIVIVKSSGAGAGEFSSISAAVASITDSGPSKPYVVRVNPGNYVEPPIVLPDYVHLIGVDCASSTIIASTPGSTLITCTGTYNWLSNLNLIGDGSPSSIGIVSDSATSTVIWICLVSGFERGIYAKATSTAGSIVIDKSAIYDCSEYDFLADTRALIGANPLQVAVYDCDIANTVTPSSVAVFAFRGVDTQVRLYDTQFRCWPSEVCVYADDGADITTQGCGISGANIGIHLSAIGAAANLTAHATIILNSLSADIKIEHSGTQASFSGTADRTKLDIVDGADLACMFFDPANPGTILSGDIYLGPTNQSFFTNMSRPLNEQLALGILSGGEMQAGIGYNVLINPGLGYVTDLTDPRYVREISWGASSLLVPAGVSWIFVESTGTVNHSASEPDLTQHVILGRVYASGGSIDFIDMDRAETTHNYNKYVTFSQRILGVTYHAGSLVSADSSRQLTITSGQYFLANNYFTPSGLSTGSTFYQYNHTAPSIWASSLVTSVTNTLYDTGSGVASIPAGKFVKHYLYTVGQGVNEKYFLVLGQSPVDTLVLAQSDSNFIPPSHFSGGVALIAGIIVQEGQSAVQDILDLRPRIVGGTVAGSTAVVTDHGDLTGLLDDDHPQYLLVSGSRAMTGALDMGGEEIHNAGDINGVSIESHAARHLPAGLDPLATAAPLVTLSAATSNLAGTANSFSRSDHTHALDLSGFSLNSLSGVLSVSKGGTGAASLTSGRVLVGAGTSVVDTSKSAPSGSFVGTTDTQVLSNKTAFISAGNNLEASSVQGVSVSATLPTAGRILTATSSTTASWQFISDSSITGVIAVPHGGTGQSTLTSGGVLVGAGVSAVDTSKVAPGGDFVGTTDAQTLTNKTLTIAGGNVLEANKISGVSIAGTPTSGQILSATSGTSASWSNLTDSLIVGVITVPHGGTGASTLTANRFLVGAGTSPVDLTKVVPSGVVVGTTDTQTITNKTLTVSDGNLVEAISLRGVEPTATLPVVDQVLISTGSTTASWQFISDSSITGVISVTHGGTGSATLTSNKVLVGAGTSAVDLSKDAPSGAFVGTSDTQMITNKTLLAVTNTIEATSLRAVSLETSPPAIGEVLIADTSTTASWQFISDSSITGTITVPHGGTSRSTLTSNKVLIGAGTGPVDLSKDAPSGSFVGTSDTQTLTNKTILISGGNTVEASSISGVSLPGSAPSTGQVLIALTPTTTDWEFVSDTSITGTISVPHGGTGASTLTSNRFLVGAGTATVDTSKVVPSGTVVGTTDMQTLTNKTLTVAGGNTLEATHLQTVSISGTAPVLGQTLVATSPTAASWQTQNINSLAGTLDVDSGGTGVSTLAVNRFLVGAGTAAVDTSKVVPSGVVVGTTDTQTLTNKTLTVAAGNLVEAASLRTVSLDVISPVAGQFLVAASPTLAEWVTLDSSYFSSPINVSAGGTGTSSLTAGRVLVGAGTATVDLSKSAPSGSFVGTTDTQTLSNKNIILSSGNFVEAGVLTGVTINATAPTAGQVLTATSGTVAAWSALNLSAVSGTLSVTSGGTGVNNLTAGRVLVGAGTSAVDLTKIAPSGAFVGASDTQTLTNKTLLATTNTIESTSLRTVALSITAPTSGQVLVATSSTTAAWQNISVSSLSGTLSVSSGGTGVNTLTSGRVLIGAGTGPVDLSKAAPSGIFVGDVDSQTLSNKNIHWVDSNVVDATSLYDVALSSTNVPTTGQVLQAISGVAARWQTLNVSALTGTLSVAAGGTGASALTSGNFLIGAGTAAVDTSKVAPAGTVVGTTDTQTILNKTLLSATNTIEATSIRAVVISATAPTSGQILLASSGTSASWGSLPVSSLSGVLPVASGGTGSSTLTSNTFLVGAGTSAVTTTKIVPTGTVVGTTDTQTLTNKTLLSATNTLDASLLRGVTLSLTAPIAGQVLGATSTTDAEWTNLTDSFITGPISVAKGGTGVSTLTAGTFLVGAGTSAVTTTKAVPVGDVVGTSDAQTLTNKTLTITGGNSLEAITLRGVTPSVTAPTAGQVLVASSSTAASWGSLPVGSLVGTLPVANGGTGASTLTLNRFLVGAGTASVDLTKAVPSGVVVGDSDTQTLTGKTISASTNALVGATHAQAVAIDTVSPTIGQILVATSPTAASWTTLTLSSFSGTLSVTSGGTGVSTLTSGRFLVGAGTSVVDTSKVVPAGAVVGTTDTQTLTNKTLLAATNTIQATSIQAVTISTTAPTANQVLIASSGTAAAWGSVPVGSLSGVLPVASGGTGASTLTSGTFLVGAGTAAVDTSKVVPGGVVVGTTDTQTLTNKTLLSATNTIESTSLRTVVISATAPTANQVLIASSGTAAAWATMNLSNITGTLAVTNGGTGASTLTSGTFLVGAGTATVDTSKVVPSGTVVGTTDTQTLTNKTLTIAGGNSLEATTVRGVTVSATLPLPNQVLVATTTTTAAWGSLLVGSLSGVLPVTSGGTGASTLTAGTFLVGAGTATVDTSKVVPAGAVVGATDTQTLTNKTLTVAGGNTVESTSIRAVVISATAPTANQVLVASSSTAASWGTVPAGSISGTLGVAAGGTGLTNLGTGFVIGNGTSPPSVTKVVPAGDVLGTTDAQTISGKTISASTNTLVGATHVQAVSISTVAPTAGQILVASSGTAAAWSGLSAASISGIISVSNGGTGASTLTSNTFLVGAGTSAVTTTKVVPVGVVVGTTDTQTLTNKTMTIAGGNSLEANTISGVLVAAVAPTAGQALVATSGSVAAWGSIGVAGGGTGASTLTAGNFLIGAGTGIVDTSKVAPAGAVVGTTDTQTLFSKTLLSATNTIEATSVRTVVISATAPTANQVLVASSGTAASWGSVPASSISGTLPVASGGTGASTLTAGSFLVGAGTSAVDTTKVVPVGTVVGTTDTQTLTNKTLLSATNIIEATSLRTVFISGTAPTVNQVLIATSSTGAAWGSVPVGSLSGTLPVSSGGTGATSFTSGNVLVGAGTSAITATSAAPTGSFVGTTDTQTLTNKTLTVAGGNTIESTSVRTVVVSATAPTSGQVLSATSGTSASWTTPTAGVATTTVDAIVRWGDTTGKTLNNSVATLNSAGTITTTNFSFANTTGSGSGIIFQNSNRVFHNYSTTNANLFLGINAGNFTSTGAAFNTCAGNGTGQSLTTGSRNIILGEAAGGSVTSGSDNILIHYGNSLLATGSGNIHIGNTTAVAAEANTIRIGGTSHVAAFFAGIYSVTPTEDRFVFINSSGQLSARTTIAVGSLSGTLGVSAGGTGATSFTSGNVLVGAGTSAITATKAAPAGVFVGTTDTQTLTNKTLTVAGSNTIEATSLRTVVISGTAPTTGQVLTATSSTTAAWSAASGGTTAVSAGGTGQTSLTFGNFLIGQGTNPVDTSKVAPAGDVLGTTDFQTITNKTITAASNVSVEATGLRAVLINNTTPAIGNVLVATSTTVASWGTLPAGSISGTLAVTNGGTGLSNLTLGNFLVGAGTSAVDTTKVVPTGVVVGTTDTQTLTNKTLTLAGSNTVEATSLRTVAISGTAPTTNQVLVASGGSNASWSLITSSNISGSINVSAGGTGQSSLTFGNFLVGQGTNAVDTSKAAPSGTVVGTSDFQTLTNKTITAASNVSVEATSIRAVVISTTAPTANQVLVATSGTAAAWGSVPVGSISGTLPVSSGGTGATSFTSGNVLVGAGTSAITATSAAPSGAFVGTTDTQTLTNKTLLAATNSVQATALQTTNIATTAPTTNQVLQYNGTQWAPSTFTVSLASSYWAFRDEKTSGTAGGTASGGSWGTRDITNIDGAGANVTLASNVLTFAAGTYSITFSAPAYQVGFCKARLLNVGTAAAIAYSTNGFSATTSTSQINLDLYAVVTFASSTQVRVEQYAQTTKATTGRGQALSLAGIVETYLTGFIQQIA